MNDRLVAWLRTIFPIGWSALVAWLVSLGLPDSVTSWVSGLGDGVLTLTVGLVVYPVLRWVEARLPDGLSRLLMGSAKQPAYMAVSVGRHADGAPFAGAGDDAGTASSQGSGSTSE